jgi:hypothetical protein
VTNRTLDSVDRCRELLLSLDNVPSPTPTLRPLWLLEACGRLSELDAPRRLLSELRAAIDDDARRHDAVCGVLRWLRRRELDSKGGRS